MYQISNLSEIFHLIFIKIMNLNFCLLPDVWIFFLSYATNFCVIFCKSFLHVSAYNLSNKRLVLNFLFPCNVTVYSAVRFEASSDGAKTKLGLMAPFPCSHHSCSHLNLCTGSMDTGWHVPLLGTHGIYVQMMSPCTQSCGRGKNRAVTTTGLLGLSF